MSDPLKDEVAETTGTRSESGEEDGTPSSVQDSALQRKGEPLRRQPEEDLAVAALADAFATPDLASRAGVSSARRRTTDESGEEPDVAEYQTETTREGAREEDVPSQQLVSEAFVAPEPESRASEHRDIDEWRVENSPAAQDGSRESDESMVPFPDSKARREETPAVERAVERPDEAYDEAGALARSFDTPAPAQAEAAQASHRAISETATEPMADEVHTVTMDEAHAHEAAPASQVNATHMKIGDPRADVGSHTEVPARVNDAEKTNEAKADATLSSGFSRTSEPVASDPVSVPSATIRRSEVPHDAERDQDESLAPAQSPSRQHKPGPVIRLQPKEQSKSVQASKTSAGKRDRQDENRRIPPSVSSRPTQHPRQRARMGQPLRFDPRRNRNPRDNA
ncbi:hypothetical protein [Alicyclobacillus acidocaldarius]|uniref:Uncharacterized protein n=1 Tax=Alicyclobacillus acidocaldarius (strain Tc-4-1) TaxID=1048834 RepID=F8ILB2_ALIAT|nr:hypothetical protein [Alicyclobacillus acidocaldarius]AEJ43678.1 hypothetical protein TC41_1751 [Alicyclobacillus acidocaldarius subsp. acidocaldarius Tc-4-1]